MITAGPVLGNGTTRSPGNGQLLADEPAGIAAVVSYVVFVPDHRRRRLGSGSGYACERSCANWASAIGPTVSVLPVMLPVATASRAVMPGCTS